MVDVYNLIKKEIEIDGQIGAMSVFTLKCSAATVLSFERMSSQIQVLKTHVLFRVPHHHPEVWHEIFRRIVQ